MSKAGVVQLLTVTDRNLYRPTATQRKQMIVALQVMSEAGVVQLLTVDYDLDAAGHSVPQPDAGASSQKTDAENLASHPLSYI